MLVTPQSYSLVSSCDIDPVLWCEGALDTAPRLHRDQALQHLHNMANSIQTNEANLRTLQNQNTLVHRN